MTLALEFSNAWSLWCDDNRRPSWRDPYGQTRDTLKLAETINPETVHGVFIELNRKVREFRQRPPQYDNPSWCVIMAAKDALEFSLKACNRWNPQLLEVA